MLLRLLPAVGGNWRWLGMRLWPSALLTRFRQITRPCLPLKWDLDCSRAGFRPRSTCLVRTVFSTRPFRSPSEIRLPLDGAENAVCVGGFVRSRLIQRVGIGFRVTIARLLLSVAVHGLRMCLVTTC